MIHGNGALSRGVSNQNNLPFIMHDRAFIRWSSRHAQRNHGGQRRWPANDLWPVCENVVSDDLRKTKLPV